MSVKKKYYPFLDGLRAVAILWIVLYHVDTISHPEQLWGGFSRSVFAGIIRRGFLGVDIFFVLSGFLITGLLLDGFNRKEGVKIFYARRFFKIIPHYYVAVATGLVITGLIAPRFLYSPKVILSYFFLYNNFVPHIPILSHMWCIAVIGHFYIVLPLVMFLAALIWKDPARRERGLLIVFLVLIAMINMLRWHFCVLPVFNGFPGGWQMTPFRLDALLFGCVLKLLEPYLRKMEASGGEGIALFTGASAVLIFVYLICNFSYGIWYHYTLSYVAAGLLLVAGLKGGRFFKAVMESKPLIWVGKNSYGIYLWHLIVIYPFRRWDLSSDVPTPLIMTLYLVTVVFFGAFTRKTIEGYFLRVREKLISS